MNFDELVKTVCTYMIEAENGEVRLFASITPW